MKYDELQRTIQRQGLASLYAILGEEDFFRAQAIHTLRHALPGRKRDEPEGVSSPGEPLACEVLYGDETDSKEILDRAQEVPIFSSHQLLIVRWADKLSAKQGEALLPYLQAPASTATLVFEAAKLDGRLKWVQMLKRKAVIVDCPALFEPQQVGWLQHEARKRGLQLQDSAAHVLKESVSGGLFAVQQELEKLACYVPAGHTITHQDVEAVRGTQPGASVFDLAETLAVGSHGQALNIISKNLEAGEAPLRILGALIWQFRKIGKAREALDQGVAEGQVARSLGIPHFRQRAFMAVVRRMPLKRVSLGFRLFEKADSALKGGSGGSPQRIFEDLILSFGSIHPVA